MPKICYVKRKFSSESLAIISKANEIIEDMLSQGFDLTLRQLYYQFVSKDIIPNTERSYKNLGSIVNDARLAGLIDWDHISDRTRTLRQNSHWDSPDDIINGAAQSYKIERYNPPPNPAKITDSRASAYIAEFGQSSWELDALEPRVIVELIQKNVDRLKNKRIWAEDVARWTKEKTLLMKASKHWDKIAEQLEEDGESE